MIAVFKPRALPDFLKQCLSTEEGILGAWFLLYPRGQILGGATLDISSPGERTKDDEGVQNYEVSLDDCLPALATQLWSTFQINSDGLSLSHSENSSLSEVNMIVLELPAAEAKLALRRLDCDLPSGQSILLIIKSSWSSSFGIVKLKIDALSKAFEESYREILVPN